MHTFLYYQFSRLYLFIHDLINKFAVTHLQDSSYPPLCLTDVSSVSAETVLSRKVSAVVNRPKATSVYIQLKKKKKKRVLSFRSRGEEKERRSVGLDRGRLLFAFHLPKTTMTGDYCFNHGNRDH